VEAQPPRKGDPLGVVAVLIFVGLAALTAILVFLSIPAGFYAVFSGRLSTTLSYASLVHPYFWVGPVPMVLGGYVSAGAAFAALMAVYVAMLGYGLFQQVRPWRAAGASFRDGFGALMSSPFLVMLVSIGFLTFSASLIDDLTSATGTPIGSVAGDPLELLVGFTFAPLVEEVGFRVVIIGLIAMALCIGRPWKEALGALWRPSRAMEGAALGGGTAMVIWATTGFSALTFGACHVACGGSGWQIGKLPEATFGGLVLGYVYVKYGLHVAVVTHWGVDFFGSAFSFFGQAAYGIPWNSATTEYVGQALVDYDMLFLFGLASFLLVMYYVVRRAVVRGRPGEERFNPPHPEGVAQA
jgi:Type II CAAX prenyl endopeptidase Rce1-like